MIMLTLVLYCASTIITICIVYYYVYNNDILQPLVHSMEGRLFGRSEEQRRKQEEIKVRSLIRCGTERQQLRSCFRNSWFGWCHKEQQIFWDCFTKVTSVRTCT